MTPAQSLGGIELVDEQIRYLDLKEIGQMKTSRRKEILVKIFENKVDLLTLPPDRPYCGSGSKEVVVNRLIGLDDLFFEGLGLWVGEGGKAKGIYIGNSCPELLLRFLDFVEKKIGIDRRGLRVTLNSPSLTNEHTTRERWSKMLQIPAENFTAICEDPRMNQEYAQIYFNSVVLVELLKTIHEKVKSLILSQTKFAVAYLRGIFAAEGSVILRKSGILHHLNISSKDEKVIEFLKECLASVGITPSEYQSKSRNLPIHSWRNFKRFKELGIHTLHPEKREKFEHGFANYKRTNVLDGEEARSLILQQLTPGPKTYDELAAALGKARTTIQAHHIPILERRGLVKFVGKRGQASLWAIAEGKITPPPNDNRAQCEEPTSCSCKSPTTSRQALASSAP